VSFRFGAYELDEQVGELRRDGIPVPLQPKPFALLAFLIAERERIVPVDEIFATLWPDTAVTPSSITRAVSHARRAIGDTNQGAILRSFPRRGYRFCAEVTVVPSSGSSADEPAQGRGTGEPPPFVGRVDALSRLERAWSRAMSGESRIVLLSGPAGIGKTRLTEVFTRGVAERGGLVCAGRARDGEGVPAFWIFVQILRALLAEPSLAAEVRGLGGHARQLSGLLPELADEPHGETNHDAEGSRFLFFEAVARLLARCARRRPLLLVLEDLQWAGLASLRLLEHVVFELAGESVLLVATLRDVPRERGHPLNTTLGVLRALDRCEQIELGRLTSGDVSVLLRQVLGRAVPPDLASELLARTEGVPLFLREALRVLEENDALRHPGRTRSGLFLGGRALDLIQRSLDELSEASAALMGAAAVLGREFSLPVVAAVAELERSEAAELLDEAVQAGLLEEDGLATYRFAHALHQELAYASLAKGRRARLHLRAAELLERQCGGDFERVAAELADHHHRALAVGNPERAFALAACAAQRASRLFAYEQAAMHYEQAASALEHTPTVDSRTWIATQLSLGEAYRLSGDRERRREVFGRALDRARALRMSSEFARAAIGFCDISEWSPHDAIAQTALREALERLGDDDGVLRAGLLSRLAYLEMFESDGAQPLAREAVQVAREAGAAGPLQDALYTLHYTLSGPDHLAERDALSREVAGLARQSGPRNVAVIVLVDSACDALMEGDAERARERRTDAAAATGDVPTLVMTWHLRVYDAGLALLEGRLDAALDLAEDAHRLGRRIAHPYAQGSFNAQCMCVARERGGYEEVIARLEPALDAFERGGLTVPEVWIRAILARSHLALGRRAEVAERFEQLAAQALEVPRDLRWLVSLIEVAHLCADLGERGPAEALCDLLEPVEHCHGVLLAPICYGGPVAYARARLLDLLGRSDESDELYALAEASVARLGAEPMRARILADHARLVARRDARRGAELMQEAHDLARTLGLGGLGPDPRRR
jgi:DNA-binding winged helix-turn-helix (wHTH) protein/tetratricopeptide (TPR) repeat protein